MSIRVIALFIIMLSAVFPAYAATTWDAYVVQVEDGNTVTVSTKMGSEEPDAVLLFYGIDAPSLSQPYGPQAQAYLQPGQEDLPGLQAWLDYVAESGHASMDPQDLFDSPAAKFAAGAPLYVLER